MPVYLASGSPCMPLRSPLQNNVVKIMLWTVWSWKGVRRNGARGSGNLYAWLSRKQQAVSIQKQIKLFKERSDENFCWQGCDWFTVTHRLETVLGYDNKAVLGAGLVLESGSPKMLLKNPSGALRQLVEADCRSKRKATPKGIADFPGSLVPAR